jgi:hypothetical protein
MNTYLVQLGRDICVFDLDQTVFPSEHVVASWGMDTTSIETAAASAIHLAQKLYGTSNVIIVTAATKQWVTEVAHRKNGGELKKLLQQALKGRPTLRLYTHERDYESDGEYKKVTFANLAREPGVQSVLSIGDGPWERNAVMALRPDVVRKSIKFVQDPSVDDLYMELQKLFDILPGIRADTSNMDEAFVWFSGHVVLRPFSHVYSEDYTPLVDGV